MTKFNIRSLSIAHLQIEKGDKFLDIGGGTGSVSIEAALQGAEVSTVEFNEEASSLILENAKKFGVKINIILGKAPEALLSAEYKDLQFDKCFIGGSGGELNTVMDMVFASKKHPTIVISAITLETVAQISDILKKAKEYDYDTDVTAINVSKSKEVGPYNMMIAQNMVFIAKLW